ncbi:PREDICTED: stomatin-like protein 2, mitochondrial [Gekko japonicus]|uniref:Stomatin-like protein 2, mitochondrial n=1 Tax=Gekko japonicus TaxID=146911 RepID=A0ABM1JLG0_GEKJA|nr:PREDICTED: stomatin-like protein 2, mitochondrial [Gekko japonicus]
MHGHSSVINDAEGCNEDSAKAAGPRVCLAPWERAAPRGLTGRRRGFQGVDWRKRLRPQPEAARCVLMIGSRAAEALWRESAGRRHGRPASTSGSRAQASGGRARDVWGIRGSRKCRGGRRWGLNFLIPFLDRIRYVQSLKEIVINVPEQSAVSHDNVTLQIDGVLYLRIMDPYKASYGVEDPEYAVTQLAQTTMRSELGKLSLDKVFRERENLNASIVDAINQASDYWGIRCLRYEIKDIHVPPRVKESMQMQVEAERRKRATVLESEGTRESAINVAEGQKQAQILASEGERAERINKAAGEANALLVKAQAKAEAIRLLAAALAQQNGDAAASLSVAEQYVSAFSKLAKEGNTLLLPSNTGDISSMVTQAMGIYATLSKPQVAKGGEAAAPPAPWTPQPPSTEHPEPDQPHTS